MPTRQRSHPGSLRGHPPGLDAPAPEQVDGLDSPVHDSPGNPLIQGLRDIFGAFASRPDFSGFCEPDLDRRLYKPWARVGDAMRLALGQPVTLVVTRPDGTRTAHVVGPAPSSEGYWAALHQAEEMMPELDEDLPAGQVVITTTREEAARLLALFERNTEDVSERG